MKNVYFADLDFSDFWDDDEYALDNYVGSFPTDEIIASAEKELGYKLPASYIELMKLHNGGMPLKTCFPTTQGTSWAEDHAAITGIMGIGSTKTYSLCGTLGSKFMIDEWGYPDTGIYICDCPSAGHDMVMLDYSKCGENGEPEVVHVDQESDYKKTFLAKDFETFIRGLVSEDVFDTTEQDLEDTLITLKTGSFSKVLQEYFKQDTSVNFDVVLRNLFEKLTIQKGYFALHADPLSTLAYDIQFYLLTLNRKINSKEEFVEAYLPMVALSNGEITTGGYADFFIDWFQESVEKGKIIWHNGFMPSIEYTDRLFLEIKKYQ